MMNTTNIKPLSTPYSLIRLVKEVSELGEGLRKGDADAKARLDQYEKFMSEDKKPRRAPNPSLEAAIVAREYGFSDWDTLSVFVNGMNAPGAGNNGMNTQGADVNGMNAPGAGIGGMNTPGAEINGMNAPGAEIRAFEDAVDAVVNGDEHALRALLRMNPSLARAQSLRVHHATLLHYTSANGIENYRQRTPSNIVTIARMLLEAGAEVDAPLMDGGKGTTLGLVATSIHPDREGVQLELMALLLDAGAAVDGLPNGWQPMMAALANGRPKAAELLADRGAYMTVVAAAGLGREELVRSYFTPAGEYIPTKEKLWHVPEEPERQLMRAFMYACIYGHKACAAWLIEHGVDPGVQDDDGYTALHWTVHGGHVELVKFLLSLGAPLELKNCYDGTVLGQLLWSAANNAGGWGGNDPEADYPAIAALLIDAGAYVWPGTLEWWRGLTGVTPWVWEGIEGVLRRREESL